MGGTSLHKALVQKHVIVPTEKTARKKKQNGPLTAESKGIETFEKFEKFTLTKTHRFPDKVQAENMQALRSTTAEQPVGRPFLESLRTRTVEEMRVEEIRFAPIGVVSNRERAAYNAAQALAFARFHGRVLVRWKLELRGPEAQNLSQAMRDTLYAEEPSLWGFFVYGEHPAASHARV